ncbi:TM0106 family RecB-like putative nuclease [Candidatus Gracilibacteria bacterium]|nr:TM0106 family RecB-like putative nuclease [Candidatus Gracilibacteria bacterium]
MSQYITASKLYDYLQCPHRVWRDVHGPQDEKIKESNPFVELLWSKGVQHEEKILSLIGEYLDLTDGSLDDRFEKTVEAMNNKAPLIYQGVLRHEDMLGIPDLLKKLPDDSYIPVDIKSGMAFEGGGVEEVGGEGKPKKHYAVQLCLYTDLLKRLGFANHHLGRIIDIDGQNVEYDLMALMSVRAKETWWEFYEKIKGHVSFLLKDQYRNKPMNSSKCKLCPWYNSCQKWCKESGDLTNVFYLGRSDRDRLNEDLNVETLDELIDLDVEEVMELKKREKKAGNGDFLYRIGEDSLKKAMRRANVLQNIKEPVLLEPIAFPEVKYELFFDIEDDPTQEFVYLHGVYERSEGKERFLDFTATELSNEAEKEAWGRFWDYIKSLPIDDFSVYYFSHHEKTTYKKLQKKYPDVISMDEVVAFFENPNVIDLYSVVQKDTDWPLSSYSLKALAVYLGFEWRDETPSGALSIQWFNEYLDGKDEAILKRILEYNEDDCKATMVLKDGIEKLELGLDAAR